MKIRDVLPILLAGQALVVLVMLVVVIVQVSLSRAVWRVERALRQHEAAHTPRSTGRLPLDGAASEPTRRIR
jgi:hypothetical protein